MVDNALNSSFISDVQTGRGAGFAAHTDKQTALFGPTDRHRSSDWTNHANGRSSQATAPIPQAGNFYNGADLDRGPSDLAFNHTLMMNGAVSLPWQLELSGSFAPKAVSIFQLQRPTPLTWAATVF